MNNNLGKLILYRWRGVSHNVSWC